MSSSMTDLYRHPAQLLKNLAAPAQRPPIVKIDLHRLPHRHPASDGQPFRNETRERAGLFEREQVDCAQTREQEQKPHSQTHPALFHEAFELQMVQPRSIGKIVVHGLFGESFGVVSFRQFLQMHD